MQQISLGFLNYEFSRFQEPRISIESGETIRVESEDALSGQIRKAGDLRDKTRVPFSNPLTGPIFINQAEPGDTLAIKIEAIESRDGQCATYTGNPKQLCQWLGTDVPDGAHVCPIRDGYVYWSDQIKIPYQPMLGCIGTTPAYGMPSTMPAGPHGGNMDIREVTEGNTLYLPVFVPGALLYLGDAHAAMGQGELSATGLEMAAQTTLTIELIKQKTIAGPRIESPNELMTVSSGTPMERATADAFAQLILWLEADYGWNRWRAYDLLTHVAEISMGYYEGGGLAVKIAKEYVAHPS
ncbi:acetamidase/formamidase family protein [Gimesia maris]|jgi:acetamidase/formamidase|uniref:acetamidase/formamidase family protein n=1 Tax=Gimesia maris TaxID=122 RepID=UPI000C0BB19F|nr:acetamidase/formamidase family protein [Gimesia maris]MAC55686.1 acetamidase [Gimesia sp.]QDT79752.1 Formamidase [Gimesia maris]|tara:strand:+ start:50070 stop:50960 length:891 start_codon:yes stop_codon:yes gene_type:complete